MPCISSKTAAALKARLAIKEAQLTAADTLLTTLFGDPNQSYRFDSGEGSQMASSKKIKDVQASISVLESEITRILNKLSRRGLTNMNMRRGNRWG